MQSRLLLRQHALLLDIAAALRVKEQGGAQLSEDERRTVLEAEMPMIVGK